MLIVILLLCKLRLLHIFEHTQQSIDWRATHLYLRPRSRKPPPASPPTDTTAGQPQGSPPLFVTSRRLIPPRSSERGQGRTYPQGRRDEDHMWSQICRCDHGDFLSLPSQQNGAISFFTVIGERTITAPRMRGLWRTGGGAWGAQRKREGDEG